MLMEFKNLLQQANYTLVFPKQGIQPLSLIQRRKKNLFTFFKKNQGEFINADLRDLFISSGRGGAYPKITEQELPKELLGSDLIDGDGSFTANFIAHARFQGNASVKKSKVMLFSFKNAKELSINQVKLDEYLHSSKLNENSPTFNDEVKKGRIYIVTSVLQCNEMNLRNAEDYNIAGGIKADALVEYLNASASTSMESRESFVIENKGGLPLSFAIKAVRILHENGKYRIKPEKIAVRKADSEYDYCREEEVVIE